MNKGTRLRALYFAMGKIPLTMLRQWRLWPLSVPASRAGGVVCHRCEPGFRL